MSSSEMEHLIRKPDETEESTVDSWRIHFRDGTSTIMHVSIDDQIEDSAVDLCEQHGWNAIDINALVYLGPVNRE